MLPFRVRSDSWGRSVPRHAIAPLILLGGLCSGCIHPNIPSLRHAQHPGDGGQFDPLQYPLPPDMTAAKNAPHALQRAAMNAGYFSGEAEPARAGRPLQAEPCTAPTTMAGSPRLPGGPVHCPPDDLNETRTGVLADFLGSPNPPREPEVPWPRFHPLPTRPVL